MRIAPRWIGLLLAFAGILPARPSRADVEVDATIHAVRIAGNLDGRSLDSTPAFKALDLRIRGAGTFTGAGALMIVHDRRFRGGFGFNVFGVSGTTLAHRSLSSDLHLSYGGPWGMDCEVFGGKVFDFGRVLAYADLRLGLAALKTSIGVRSDRIGEVQSFTRGVMTPLLAPRIGAQMRLSTLWSIDVGASYSVVGMEGASFYAGVVFTPASLIPPMPPPKGPSAMERARRARP